MWRRFWHTLVEHTRRYFVAGILVFAPIGITLWAMASIVVWLDNLILPHVLKLMIPGLEDPPRLPLIGMLFTFVVITSVFLVGGAVSILYKEPDLDLLVFLQALPFELLHGLVFVLPLSTLISVVFVYGRMASDNELTTLKASGSVGF